MAAFVSTRPCCEPGQPVHPRPLGCWRRGCHMDGSGTQAPSMSSTGLSLCARGGARPASTRVCFCVGASSAPSGAQHRARSVRVLGSCGGGGRAPLLDDGAMRAHPHLPLSLTQCPSERPRRTPTAGGGPPARWPPPGSCCDPTVTTTSTPARPTGLSVRPPPTSASRPSCCSRRPARPTGLPRPSGATPPGPAAGPPRSTGWAEPARMPRGPGSPGTSGKERPGRWGAREGSGSRGTGERDTSMLGALDSGPRGATRG